MPSIAGHKVNEKSTVPMTLSVGKLIVNFGALEFESFRWILRLSDATTLRRAGEKSFEKRVQCVRKLVKASGAGKPWKTQADAAWKTVLRLQPRRNEIAHNPIWLSWSGSPEQGPADLILIADVKKAVRSGLTAANRPLRKVELDGYVDEAVRVYEQLSALFREWDDAHSAADQGSQPP